MHILHKLQNEMLYNEDTGSFSAGQMLINESVEYWELKVLQTLLYKCIGLLRSLNIYYVNRAQPLWSRKSIMEQTLLETKVAVKSHTTAHTNKMKSLS